MSSTRTTWRAKEPEAAARRVAGRPVQAFWPLLAPSFRWVLLPPHRHTGVDEIEWEWRASPSPIKPSAADLNDLRARLRDSLDLLATDLRRRPSLPEGLAAAALLDEFEQIFGALRHAPDPILAEYAVLTDLGWLLRSWGVARPSPARANAPAPSTDGPAANSTKPDAPAGASSRRKRRLLVWALLGVTIAAAVWWTYHDNETTASADEPTPAENKTEQIDTNQIAADAPPRDVGPAKDQKPQTVKKTLAPVTRAASSSPATPGANSPGTGVTTPAALTGAMASTPEALEPKAGPPSKVKGATETPPGIAARRSDTSTGTSTETAPADTPAGRPPGDGANSPSGQKDPAPAPGKAVAREPEKIDRASTPEASPPTRPESANLNVEARAAPAPTPPPATLPGRSGDARSDEPRETTSAEVNASEQLPGNAPQTFASKDQAPEPSAGEAIGTEGGAKAAGTAPDWDAPARRLRLRSAPWRLMLERDIVLPSRPFEGTGEAEIRAARIAAWAQARSLTPPAFRRKEILAGWTFTFDPAANTQGPLSWRAKSGALAVQETDAAGGRARLGWQESETGELDAWLTDAAGSPVARVWRKPDENRLWVFASPSVREIRPWFALRLRPADPGDGVEPPKGWTLENGKRQLLAEGPEGATRMRWSHAESGWVLHGGYTREAP